MDSYEIKAVADHGVKGRDNDVLALIKLPYAGYYTVGEQEFIHRKVLALYDDIKELYRQNTEGSVSVTLTVEAEEINI
tara:strand:+ start:419 stop:652 length:234 start_codon:yes stop_codon:yes gene_type:complete